jgi:hypothetical protein
MRTSNAVLGLFVVILGAAPALGAGATLVKGQKYHLQGAIVCVNEAAIDDLVKMRNHGIPDVLPGGCAVGELEEFRPEQKIAGRTAWERREQPDADGNNICSNDKTGETFRCRLIVDKTGVIAGTALRRSDRQSVRVFVEMFDTVTIAEGPK